MNMKIHVSFNWVTDFNTVYYDFSKYVIIVVVTDEEDVDVYLRNAFFSGVAGREFIHST